MEMLLKEFGPSEWGGLTTKNNLGAAYLLPDQKASDKVEMIWQAMVGGGNDLVSMLSKYPKLYLDTDDSFYWDLMSSGEKNIPLVSAHTSEANALAGTAITAVDTVGIAFSEFYLLFPEDYFFDVNIIFGDREEYQVRILDEPTLCNGNFLYRCSLMTGDETLFIPFEYLQAGKRFSKQYSAVESTLSKKGGKVNYNSHFRMRNYFTRIRMQDECPGNMISRPFGVTITNGKQTFNQWMQYRDWQFEDQFRQEKNNMFYYSRLNKAADGTFKNKGKSGYELEQGAGLKQQIESAGIFYYPTDNFDIKVITDVMLDLSVNRLRQDQRKFVLRTGERGMVQWHEAIERVSKSWTQLDTNRVTISGNAMTFRGQFLKYIGPNGIELTVEHDPMKDDTAQNKINHPNGGKAEAYTYDLLDLGTSQGEPNIRLVYQKGAEDIRGYIPGLRNPFTPNMANNPMANGVDGYIQHKMTIGGVMVKDPRRCMIIKPNILQ